MTAPDNIALLRASIAHWEELAAVEDRLKATSGPYAKACPLCTTYQYQGLPLCQHCPICLATGYPDCRATPYEEAYSAWVDWNGAATAKESADKQASARDRFREHAAAEIEFLRSILKDLENDKPT